MTEVAQRLPQTSKEMIYTGNRSVAPASLNALTESDGHDGFNSASNGQPSPRHIADSSAIFCAGRFALWHPQASRGAMDATAQDTKTAVREALESAARMLESRAGNAPYVKAWRRAAQLIRSQKPD